MLDTSNAGRQRRAIQRGDLLAVTLLLVLYLVQASARRSAGRGCLRTS